VEGGGEGRGGEGGRVEIVRLLLTEEGEVEEACTDVWWLISPLLPYLLLLLLLLLQVLLLLDV